MIKPAKRSAFTLVLTLIVMAMIVVTVTGYLVTSRSDRVASNLYAKQLESKVIADSGLASAMHLLRENTRYGNYITAMPSPSPAPHRTELYRPVNADDFLRLDNAVGEALVSLATTNTNAQIEPRPPAKTITASSGHWGLADPQLTASNSYNFNQVVRLGGASDGRLVHSDGGPAFGQWVNIRDTGEKLTGRYAFFIEDESMKVNINASGNNLAGGPKPNRRINDLVPIPSPTPTVQIQEVDPSAVIPAGADQGKAISTLISARPAASPPTVNDLPSKGTIALLDEWKSAYPDYAHLITASSKDDNTTARGWLRMNLNQIIKDAEAVGTNAAKADAATKISDWIKAAWTGPTAIADLKQDADGRKYQLYNDDRLRLQIAASIVDYIDSDNIPTDLDDVPPDTGSAPIPVLGIERILQLTAVMVIYQAKDRATAPPKDGKARATAKMSMKLRFNFINLFDTALTLEEVITRIEVEGIPVITKASEAVFDKKVNRFSIAVADLKAVNGTGSQVPPGQNNTSGSGVRSFETDWLVSDEVKEFSDSVANPIFSPVDQMSVKVFGPSDQRLDSTAMAWNDTPITGFRQGGTTTPSSTSAGDFLRDVPVAKPGVTRQIAAIFLMESSVPSGSGTLTRQLGDPRYRPKILNERWRRIPRTDTESAFISSALQARVDQVDIDLRTAGFDWYDETSNRPLAFIRNSPMLSTGELGNVAASEYPWRSLYLQHPDRPSNSTSAIVIDEVATKRRLGALDWVLPGLFRVSATDTRVGGININTRFDASGEQRVLDSLFLGLPIGEQAGTQQPLTSAMVHLLSTDSGSTLAAVVADRRKTGATLPDNNPVRPFFEIGELASVLSRLFSASMLNLSVEIGSGGTNRSTVTYSALRAKPDDISELNENYRSDMHVEQGFREVSESITTRGNIFRVLYVGQSVRDINKDGAVGLNETTAEHLGEAFVERVPVFTNAGGAMKTTDSRYKVLSQRTITE